jgi:catechol 2,3-dioxygenase-like lactoylglutathione lyase family enzyme
MNWSIHHVNLESRNVRKTAAFYTAILGMEEKDWIFPATRGYLPGDPGKLALFGDGRGSHTGLHLIHPDPDFADRNNLMHNPSIGGHVAFEVSDLEAVKSRLREAGIRYSDAGPFAIPGYTHIYLEDPDGNLIEVNGRVDT